MKRNFYFISTLVIGLLVSLLYSFEVFTNDPIEEPKDCRWDLQLGCTFEPGGIQCSCNQ